METYLRKLVLLLRLAWWHEQRGISIASDRRRLFKRLRRCRSLIERRRVIYYGFLRIDQHIEWWNGRRPS